MVASNLPLVLQPFAALVQVPSCLVVALNLPSSVGSTLMWSRVQQSQGWVPCVTILVSVTGFAAWRLHSVRQMTTVISMSALGVAKLVTVAAGELSCLRHTSKVQSQGWGRLGCLVSGVAVLGGRFGSPLSKLSCFLDLRRDEPARGRHCGMERGGVWRGKASGK